MSARLGGFVRRSARVGTKGKGGNLPEHLNDPDRCTVRVERHPSFTVLALEGELDLGDADSVEGYLRSVEASRPETIVVDLSGLSFIDSTGLAVLIRAHARSADAGRRLAMVPGGKTVQRVLSVTGLDRVFEILPEGVDPGEIESPEELENAPDVA